MPSRCRALALNLRQAPDSGKSSQQRGLRGFGGQTHWQAGATNDRDTGQVNDSMNEWDEWDGWDKRDERDERDEWDEWNGRRDGDDGDESAGECVCESVGESSWVSYVDVWG